MDPATLPASEDLGHGITAIDTGFVRPFFDASHLLVENGRAAFVDVGTTFSAPAPRRRARRRRGCAPRRWTT